MQQGTSRYELGKTDYAWALRMFEDDRTERGVAGATQRVIRWSEWIEYVLIGAFPFVLTIILAVIVALNFGLFHIVTLVTLLLVPLLPGLCVIGKWFWNRWEYWGVEGSTGKNIRGSLMRHLEKGKTPLPFGSVEVEWDSSVLRVSGGGEAVEVAWSARPVVRREGERVLVMPFGRIGGVGDLARMAVVRSEAFPDDESFARAVEEWSSYAGGR